MTDLATLADYANPRKKSAAESVAATEVDARDTARVDEPTIAPSNAENKSAKAADIWASSEPIHPSSSVAKYFASRGIEIDDSLPIRCRPAHTARWKYGSAVFAAMDEDGNVLAVTQTYLHPKTGLRPPASDTGTPNGKRTNGPIKGNPIRFPAKPNIIGPLCLTEGPEDAASIRQATGFETWACGGAQYIQYAPIPKSRAVVICRDNDEPGSPADQDIGRAIHRFRQNGVKIVDLATPPEGFKDANEVLMAQGNKGVWDYIDKRVAAQPIPFHAQPAPKPAGGIQWRDYKDKHCTLPAASLRNTVIAINALGIECKLDLFHGKTLIGYRGDIITVQNLVGELTDNALGGIRSIIDKTYGFDPSDNNVFAAVREIACEHAFDPVKDYLDGCEAGWDGKARIDRLLPDYFGAPDTPLNKAIGPLSLNQSVARVRDPACKVDEITVLEGIEGTEKSTGIETLYGKENFSDQSILNVSDREVQELVSGVWGYEIADLTGITRADAERVKAFASRNTDRARKAYGRVREDVPRRCKFWATTNDEEYLASQTGNRRWWPVKVGKVDIIRLRNDRDQLWGEAAARYTAGASIRLDPSLWPTAAEQQEQRRQIDPWEEILRKIPESIVVEAGTPLQHRVQVIWKVDDQERVASGTLLTYVLRIPPAQQHANHGKRLAQAMARLGWQRPEHRKVWIDNLSVNGFWRDDIAKLAVQAGLALEYTGAKQ